MVAYRHSVSPSICQPNLVRLEFKIDIEFSANPDILHPVDF